MVAFAIARPKRAREQKQSCRAQAAHAWIWAIASVSPFAEFANCQQVSRGPASGQGPGDLRRVLREHAGSVSARGIVFAIATDEPSPRWTLRPSMTPGAGRTARPGTLWCFRRPQRDRDAPQRASPSHPGSSGQDRRPTVSRAASSYTARGWPTSARSTTSRQHRGLPADVVSNGQDATLAPGPALP